MSENKTNNEPIILESSHPLLYADRILNFSTGATISKLILGVEVAPGQFAPSATLVIPTSAMLDALIHIQNSYTSNSDIKDKLIKGAEILKTQFEKLGE